MTEKLLARGNTLGYGQRVIQWFYWRPKYFNPIDRETAINQSIAAMKMYADVMVSRRTS